MSRSLAPVLALALLLPLTAQQSGDANRDYTINGSGSGGSSFVLQTLLSPGAFDQTYTTMDPAAPVVWLANSTGCIGSIVSSTNSLDVCFDASLQFLGDGTDGSSFLNQLFFTDASGTFDLGAHIANDLSGLTIFLTMAHVAASSSQGFWSSQTHEVSWSTDGSLTAGTGAACNPAGTNLMLGDDASLAAAFGFGLDFYGVTYTECYVGSNGSITFGAGDTDFTESVSELLADEPRIALFWHDLSPNVAGSVVFHTDNSGQAEVCFNQVPEFGSTLPNQFWCRLGGGLILLEYGTMALSEALVGVSPGGNLDPLGTALNLSLGGSGITAGSAAYELFDPTNPADIAGFQVRFTLDATGNPIQQL